MKSFFLSTVALVAALVGVALTVGSTFAQNPSVTCVYVPEAGHNIQGPFWTFYNAHNGAENFGPPLTEAFLEKGLVVQYFQRARFEFHPEYPEPYRVQLALLGMQYGITDPPIRSSVIPRPDDQNYAYFPATGLLVPTVLKKYFDAHGGWELFGYPVSNIRYEGKYFTQYFQRARLEWYVLESRVVASPVGQITLEKTYPSNFRWLARAVNDWCSDPGSAPPVPTTPGPSIAQGPVNVPITVQVRVRFRQTGASGPQYVDVTAFDQNSKPVPGVGLIATVRFANGDRVFPLLATDSAGKATFSFEIGNQSLISPTVVEVKAFSGASTAVGQDYFTR
ncbi:MAG: hypothetical protein HY782_21195 [Chloroflexi bacterium]|nr:hypothetical protein [Chloroflexota bacterium]